MLGPSACAYGDPVVLITHWWGIAGTVAQRQARGLPSQWDSKLMTTGRDFQALISFQPYTKSPGGAFCHS